jgi:hypothetical protein
MAASLKIAALAEVLDHLTDEESRELAKRVERWRRPIKIKIHGWGCDPLERMADNEDAAEKLAKELSAEFVETMADIELKTALLAITPISDTFRLCEETMRTMSLLPLVKFDNIKMPKIGVKSFVYVKSGKYDDDEQLFTISIKFFIIKEEKRA